MSYECYCHLCHEVWHMKERATTCKCGSTTVESRPDGIKQILIDRGEKFPVEYLQYCAELLQVVPITSVLDNELNIEDTPEHREELNWYRV